MTGEVVGFCKQKGEKEGSDKGGEIWNLLQFLVSAFEDGLKKKKKLQ